MSNDKYLSNYSGEQIDHAYEVVQHLSSDDENKLTYIDSSGVLQATSFAQNKVGLINVSSWGAGNVNNFLSKGSNNNEILVSAYNFYSFVGYSNLTAADEENLSSIHIEGAGAQTKYYITDTGISKADIRGALSDIEDLKQAIGGGSGGGGSDLTTRVSTLETITASLSSDVNIIKGQIGTSSQEGSILYRLSQIDNTLITKQNVIDSNNMLNADLVDDTTSTHKFATQAQLNQIQTNTNELADTRVLRYTQSNIHYGQYFSPPVGDLAHITLYHEPVIVLNELRYYYSEYKMVEGMGNCFIYTSELLYNQNGFYYKNMLIVNRSRNRIYYDMYFGDSTGIPSNDIVEFSSNKVTSLSASSTDYQYPSAKCVYDYISGTDDGTNWTSLTIGNTTKAIPSGGGGGTSVSGTNDGTNWTTITISGSTYNIPNNGSVTISQVQVNDPAKVPSSALMYSVNSRVVELETQLAAALQEINSLKQRVSAIEGDYVVAIDDHTEVEVSGNSIKFISDVTTSGNEISFTQSSTHLDGNDILL